MKGTVGGDPSTGYKRYRVDFLLHRRDATVSINVLTRGDEYKAVARATPHLSKLLENPHVSRVAVSVVAEDLTVADIENDDMHDYFEVG